MLNTRIKTRTNKFLKKHDKNKWIEMSISIKKYLAVFSFVYLCSMNFRFSSNMPNYVPLIVLFRLGYTMHTVNSSVPIEMHKHSSTPVLFGIWINTQFTSTLFGCNLIGWRRYYHSNWQSLHLNLPRPK